MKKPEKTCFIFSGGAVKGAIEVGQFKALAQSGILADYFVGVSVGALNAAYLTERITNIGQKEFLSAAVELEDFWLKNIFSRRQIYFFNLRRQRKASLFDPTPLENLIRELNVGRIFNSPIRLDVVTSVEDSPKEEVFSNREERQDEEVFRKSILASASIPGLFPLVEINGRRYFDGNSTAPLPTYLAAKKGYEAVIVLSTKKPPLEKLEMSRIKNWINALNLGIDISSAKIRFMEHNWTENININLATLERLKEKVLKATPSSDREKVALVFEEEEKNFRFFGKSRLDSPYYLYPDSKNLPSSLKMLYFQPDDIRLAIKEGYESALRQLKEYKLL